MVTIQIAQTTRITMKNIGKVVTMGHPSWGKGTIKVSLSHFEACVAKDNKFFKVEKQTKDAVKSGTNKGTTTATD